MFLCDGQGNLLESRSGPGTVQAHGRFASVFDELTADWREQRGARQAILCGMVGSRLGWRETPYLASPIDPVQLVSACVKLRGGDIRLVPGISCRNRLGAPDLMRGEETQVLGALRLDPELRRGRHLLCLPGTHTKWVVLEDGAIAEFLTVPAGELFALISQHSVLVNDDSNSWDDRAFERGLAEFARDPHVQVLHRLFQSRSRWMTGELAAEATPAFLSGLLIACDIHGALDLLLPNDARIVQVIASTRLAELYAKGIAALRRAARCFDGEAAALAGLAHLLALATMRDHAR